MSYYQNKKESGIVLRRYANDIAKELFRKSIHLCAAFIPFLLSRIYWPVIIGLSFILILYIIAESLRFHGHPIPILSDITQAAARKRDENHFVLGPVTLSLGILITALIFDERSASVGIYALALGDGLASLVGKIFGRTVLIHMQGKTAEGSLACFAAIFISCYFVTKNALAALVIGIIGMLIELLPLKDFDNLFIPVILASVVHFFF